MIVAANAADAAGDEMRVARVFALHENAVAAKNGGGGVALRDLAILKIYLGENTKTADNPGYWIPIHFDEIARGLFRARVNRGDIGHGLSS